MLGLLSLPLGLVLLLIGGSKSQDETEAERPKIAGGIVIQPFVNCRCQNEWLETVTASGLVFWLS